MPNGTGTSYCPHCRAFAQYDTSFLFDDEAQTVLDLYYRRCTHCQGLVVWQRTRDKPRLIYPLFASNGQAPSADMPEHIQRNFSEAALIASVSPRAAAALLRLCVQQLCIELGRPGKKLDDDIGKLVAQGLAPSVQQMLDTVRVIGNSAVHPNAIDVEVNEQTVNGLFWCVNMIVFDMISKPKQAAQLYAGVPAEQQQWIDERDKKATEQLANSAPSATPLVLDELMSITQQISGILLDGSDGRSEQEKIEESVPVPIGNPPNPTSDPLDQSGRN